MTAEKLPQWQADRLATLLDALDGVPLTDAERRSLAWLCGFEAATVENVAAVIHRIKARSAVLAQRASTARDEAISRHLEADRYHRQLIDLCHCEGIDPGEDPHAALMAHLRGREPGGGRS